jgi:hypothetical protein
VIPALLRPEIQRQAGEFIDFGDRCGIAGKIHNQEIALAGVAGLQPQVRKIGSGEVGKFGFRRFVTTRTAGAWKFAASKT